MNTPPSKWLATRTTNKEQQERRRNTDELANLDTTTTGPAKRCYNATAARIDNTTKVAKHPLDPPRQPSICPSKH